MPSQGIDNEHFRGKKASQKSPLNALYTYILTPYPMSRWGIDKAHNP